MLSYNEIKQIMEADLSKIDTATLRHLSHIQKNDSRPETQANGEKGEAELKRRSQEKTFVNLTPHDIVMNNGHVHKASGTVCRVESRYTEPDEHGFVRKTYGDLQGLPAPKDNTHYILSGLAHEAAKASGRTDTCAPATSHPEVKRNEKGHILSVPHLEK